MGDFEVRGADQLALLAARFKAAGDPGRGLRKELRAGLRKAMQPMAEKVKSNISGIPVLGAKVTGLRAALAAAVKIKTVIGANPRVRLFVDSAKLPFPGAADLMEGKRPWRHPVYGTDTWVSQDAHPYFTPAVREDLPRVQTEIATTLETVAAKIPEGF